MALEASVTLGMVEAAATWVRVRGEGRMKGGSEGVEGRGTALSVGEPMSDGGRAALSLVPLLPLCCNLLSRR